VRPGFHRVGFYRAGYQYRGGYHYGPRRGWGGGHRHF
jgi:hypothetical protein